MVKIQTSVADEKQRIALTDQYLALTKLDEKEKENIRTKLLGINVKNQNSNATQQETAEITKSLDKQLAQSGTKQGMSTGMAIGSAVMAGVMTAMSSYSSGTQAKNKTDAVGSGLGNALMGGLSGAVTGAMLGSVIPGIGTAIGATVGAIGGVAVSAVSTTVGYISEEGQRAVDKAVALLDEYNQRISSIKANLSSLENLQDEFDRLSRGVSNYGENISLSADEYSRYRDIVEQIVGISPSLRIGFDEEGKSLAEKNGLLEKSIALLKEENRQKLEGMVSNESLKTMLGKAKEEYKSAVKEFEDIQMPEKIKYSSKIVNGERKSGYTYQIDKYIEDVIGIPKDTWESIPEYIRNNSDKINDALAEIRTRSMQDKDGWAGVSESTAQGIMDYIGEVLQGAKKIENISKNLNPTLQLVPQTITAYDTMTAEQKKFITEYINGFQITSKTTDKEITDMSNIIKKFVDDVGNTDVKEAIGKFFTVDELKPAEEVQQLKKKYIAEIAKSLGKDPIEIQTILGYDSNLDEAKTQLAAVKPQLASIVDEIASSLPRVEIDDLITMSDEDFAKLDTSSIDAFTSSYKALKEELKNKARDEAFNKALDETKKKVTSLQFALEEQSKSGKISPETFKSITALIEKEEDCKKILDSTKDGFILLSDEVVKYIDGLLGLQIETGITNDYTKEQIAMFYDLFITIRDLNKQLDDIQSAYSSASNAIDEFNEKGYISVDTYQELLKIEPQYLSLLIDEQGNLLLTKDALIQVTEARINELAYKQASSLLDMVLSADNERDALSKLKLEIDDDANSFSALYYTKLRAIAIDYGTDSELYQETLSQLKVIEDMRQKAILGASQGGQGNVSKSSTLDKLLDTSKLYNEQLKDLEKNLEPIEEKIAKIQSELEKVSPIDDETIVLKLNKNLIKAKEEQIKSYQEILSATRNFQNQIKTTFSEFESIELTDFGIAKYRQNIENQITTLVFYRRSNVNPAQGCAA